MTTKRCWVPPKTSSVTSQKKHVREVLPLLLFLRSRTGWDPGSVPVSADPLTSAQLCSCRRKGNTQEELQDKSFFVPVNRGSDLFHSKYSIDVPQGATNADGYLQERVPCTQQGKYLTCAARHRKEFPGGVPCLQPAPASAGPEPRGCSKSRFLRMCLFQRGPRFAGTRECSPSAPVSAAFAYGAKTPLLVSCKVNVGTGCSVMISPSFPNTRENTWTQFPCSPGSSIRTLGASDAKGRPGSEGRSVSKC